MKYKRTEGQKVLFPFRVQIKKKAPFFMKKGGLAGTRTQSMFGYSKYSIFVVCLLLGDSPASEFSMPTFRNTLFHLHKQVEACRFYTHLPAYEDGTMFRNVGIYISDAGESPKKKAYNIQDTAKV